VLSGCFYLVVFFLGVFVWFWLFGFIGCVVWLFYWFFVVFMVELVVFGYGVLCGCDWIFNWVGGID